MSKEYRPSNYEVRAAEDLRKAMEDMIVAAKELNIDILEIKFEKSCSSCRLNKDCGQCMLHAQFLKALNY